MKNSTKKVHFGHLKCEMMVQIKCHFILQKKHYLSQKKKIKKIKICYQQLK